MAVASSDGQKKGSAVIDRLGEPVSRIEFYVFLALSLGLKPVAVAFVGWWPW